MKRDNAMHNGDPPNIEGALCERRSGGRLLMSSQGDPVPILESSFSEPSGHNVLASFLARKPSMYKPSHYERYLQHLSQLATGGTLNGFDFAWERVRAHHISRLVASMQELGYAQSTVGLYLTAVRGVMEEALIHNLITLEDLYKIRLIRVKGRTYPHRSPRSGRALTREVIRKLFSGIPDTFLGRRDRAILACLYPGAVRPNEIVNLDYCDYDPSTGRLEIRAAKNRFPGVILMENGAGDAMLRWLQARGDDAGPMFPPLDHVDFNVRVLVRRRMSASNVRHVVRRIARIAGVDDVKPRDFRHTTATHMDEAGCSLPLIQTHLRHRNPMSTAGYIHRYRDLRTASVVLTIPTS